MSVTTMTIDALCVSPFNARRNQHDANAITGMAESLATRGQLYPLVVHPMPAKRGKKRSYGALAGGRRLRAFALLIEQGRLPSDHPIDVIVRDITDKGELHELSLFENLVRVDLRPYEVYAAVARAHENGRTLKEIADTNGQTIETVRRWARLGNLHPTIFAALEAGEIGQDQAKAFGATDDVALQLHVFEQIARYELGDWRRNAAEIRKLLKVGDSDLEKQLRFVGEQAYRDAGGRYELDLFADAADQRGRVMDEGLLLQLADEKLESIRKRVRRQTGKELRFEPAPPRLTLGNYDQGIDNSLEITAEPEPANAADAAALASVVYEMTHLESWAAAALDDEELTDDLRAHCIAAIDEHYEPLEAMLAQLQDRMEIPLPGSQVYATLQVLQDGETELRFWWANRQAKQKAEAAARKDPEAPQPKSVSAGPIGKPVPLPENRQSLATSGAAISRDHGSSERMVADNIIRDEHGLTMEGIQVMRSIRREMLRAALIEDALTGASDTSVALDYLIWSLARDRLTEIDLDLPGRYSHERGIAGLSARSEPMLPSVGAHVKRTPAHATWSKAVAELKQHPCITAPDLAAAFDAFRAEGFGFREKVAAVVVGCALERSANAPGYQVPLHDRLAVLAGFGDAEDQRELVEPTEEMLDMLPRDKRLELVHPHVTNAEYRGLEKLKAAELSAPVVRALKKADAWVHPMLRFSADLPGTLARTLEEAAA
ncbi:hypothetical protein M527_07220 [Sphingobium indicum IP26]|nr:ParB/RepB/Spo0J family partition protein [Sphingobium indicum]EPR09907.1 hypothetical protein M527_07220 [Sphingobium indicum IP26]